MSLYFGLGFEFADLGSIGDSWHWIFHKFCEIVMFVPPLPLFFHFLLLLLLLHQSPAFIGDYHVSKLLRVINFRLRRVNNFLIVVTWLIVVWFLLEFVFVRMPSLGMEIELFSFSRFEFQSSHLELVFHTLLLCFVIWNLVRWRRILRSLSWG